MSKRFRIAVWTAQIILVVVFALTGALKTFLSPGELLAILPDLAAFPMPFVRFIGIAELAAACCLALPDPARTAPVITPAAALGLLMMMVFAFLFHVNEGHVASLPPVVILAALASFVAWARLRQRSIAPRLVVDED